MSDNISRSSSILSNLNSISDHEELEQDHGLIKKKGVRGLKRTYYADITFESAEEAIAFVKSEKIWSHPKLSKTSQGNKFFYRCNLCVERGPQCAAAIYLLYINTSQRVILNRTDCNLNI